MTSAVDPAAFPKLRQTFPTALTFVFSATFPFNSPPFHASLA